MTIEAESEFWREHLGSAESPLIHFVPLRQLDRGTLKKASGDLGFAFFVVDVEQVRSDAALLSAFAEAMNFPSYFGHNWDALLDLTRDFSWNKARGYVLLLLNADVLLSLANNRFSLLLSVLEATVREWRDERGEHGERTSPVPFHVVFSGSNDLREVLLHKLKEPLCDHEAEQSVRIIRTPGGVGGTEYFRDAEKLLQGGADYELVLSFLRERGVSEVDSIYVLAGLRDTGIPEAKTLVDNSQTWSDRYETDARIRKAARDALRDLGFL